MDPALENARKVRLMIFDVDGVLTDGRLYYTDTGAELKAFSAPDGHGMKMLMSTGIEIAILTGRTSGVVAHRAKNLGIRHVLQGVQDKGAAFLGLCESMKLSPPECGYMGDDVVDLPVLIRCGFPVTTLEAPDIVKRHAVYVAAKPAGAGAAREVCELLMHAQGTFEAALAPYLA
jgi:3-deoxy-D-manno-octulosonate 8-phosphate phosphatase (KDO 8-P phosphatase)